MLKGYIIILFILTELLIFANNSSKNYR